MIPFNDKKIKQNYKKQKTSLDKPSSFIDY